MSWVVGLLWIAGVGAVLGLVLWAGVGPVQRAFKTAGWGVAWVTLLRAIAVAGAGVGWYVLFPPPVRPSALACVLIRFLREGANSLLPITQVGGDIIGARALTLEGAPASLAAASVIVDLLVQAATQCLFAIVGLATLAATGRAGTPGRVVAVVVAIAAPALYGFYLLQRPIGRRVVKAFLARVASERKWLSFGAVDSLYRRLGSIYADRMRLFASAIINMAVWMLGACEVWVLLAFAGLPSSYPEALIIESLLQAVRGAAFAIPGALGAQEGGLIVICAIFGVPADIAIAMSLIKRVPDFIFGVPSLLAWQMREGRAFFANGAVVEEPGGK